MPQQQECLCSLPLIQQDLNIVAGEDAVLSKHNETVRLRLHDEHPVKRIPMMQGQTGVRLQMGNLDAHSRRLVCRELVQRCCGHFVYSIQSWRRGFAKARHQL